MATIKFLPDVEWLHTLEDYLVHSELESYIILYIFGVWCILYLYHRAGLWRK